MVLRYEWIGLYGNVKLIRWCRSKVGHFLALVALALGLAAYFLASFSPFFLGLSSSLAFFPFSSFLGAALAGAALAVLAATAEEKSAKRRMMAKSAFWIRFIN